ncbi:hypothetical protein AMECASPLE_013345 [Ameca splendens]|uniref:Uncharacterized protein n=1 Tax=Ameca splendens TaxID=208324 RepID=A0ABV0YZA3_9TELE
MLGDARGCQWMLWGTRGCQRDKTDRDFFCGCSVTPDIDKVLESVKAEDIMTDSEIKTEAIIRRLESILSVPGNGAENQQFILEVLLPQPDCS